MADRETQLIAIVEDDASVRESLSDLLASSGYTTRSFSSGEAFLQWQDRTAADCIISDIRMPGISGLRLAFTLRQQNPHVPVVLITAHADEESGLAAFPSLSGTVLVLRKPFHPHGLLAAIREAPRIAMARANLE